jgi:hypothetical protein
MDKTVVLIYIIYLFFGCKKGKECPPVTVKPINPSFINWTKPYPVNTKEYIRYKSNKGPEESLLIYRDINYSEWYLKDDAGCGNSRGEWRNYNLMSTVYRKWFEVSILQYSSNETQISIVNRSGGMDEGAIIFSSDKSYRFQYNPCDTCLHFFNNYLVNNKSYDKVIRMYCPQGASSFGSENVKEIYLAEGFGIIQYSCSDSTVWNLVY